MEEEEEKEDDNDGDDDDDEGADDNDASSLSMYTNSPSTAHAAVMLVKTNLLYVSVFTLIE